MADLLSLLDEPHWLWWTAGIVLVVLEVFAAGAILMWLGFAAIVTGFVAYLEPSLDWRWQFALFAVLSVTAVLTLRRWFRWQPIATDEPALNRRGAHYVGRRFVLAEPIDGGRGRLRIEDSSWSVRGPDLPAGAAVRVVAVDGATMQVVAADGDGPDDATP